MKNYVGKKWSTLTEEEKERMTLCLSIVDGRTCNRPMGSMPCIVDLAEGLAVSGHYVKGEEEDIVLIDEDAIIYNPSL